MSNIEQRDCWSGDVGARWVEMTPFLDASFAQITRAVVNAAGPLAGKRVLDVGCGAGALSRALGVRAGHVTGVDISPAMVDAARAQAPANVDHIVADAQSDALPGAPFDAVTSQFGMMFFADTVAALTHIRAACAPGARLTFATWRSRDENPWFRVPGLLAEAATVTTPSDPDAPGPMRLRHIPQVIQWLTQAGWTGATGTPLAIDLIQPGSLDQVAHNSTRLGAASSILGHHRADKTTRRAVAQRIAVAFADYDRGGAVHIPAAINLFTARA